MKLLRKANLHIHSTHSDGLLTPEQLITLVKTAGISTISITDHDTLSATREAITFGSLQQIEVIPGIEFSASFNGQPMHILGYGISIDNKELNDLIVALQKSREERNHKILHKFAEIGITINAADLKKTCSGQIGRPHMARFLLNRGVVRSIEEAFRHYLGTGGNAYVDRLRFNADHIIAVIRKSGGVAVLAHPTSIDQNLQKIADILKSLQKEGLSGVEAFHPTISNKKSDELKKIAAELNLFITGGSDFHGSSFNPKKLLREIKAVTIPHSFLAELKNAINTVRTISQ